MTDDAIGTLQKSLRGSVIQPGDAQYDQARALYNGMIDKRPRLIARCVWAVTPASGAGKCEPWNGQT